MYFIVEDSYRRNRSKEYSSIYLEVLKNIAQYIAEEIEVRNIAQYIQN